MRVAITGDRRWGDPRRTPPLLLGAITRELAIIETALRTLDPTTDFVVLGDARGADRVALAACKELGLPYRVHRADWGRYGRAAGPRRNRAMLDDVALTRTADETVEVWYFHWDIDKSRGTRDCVLEARRRGIIVRPGSIIGQIS